MTSRDFAYWLQGFFEISNAQTLNPTQTEMVKKHLNLVFIHEIDPSINNQHSQEVVEKMNEIHNPTLQELGKIHNFTVTEDLPHGFGPCPGPGYKLSTLYGWYKESEGIPRC